jgi:hypothetical protein
MDTCFEVAMNEHVKVSGLYGSERLGRELARHSQMQNIDIASHNSAMSHLIANLAHFLLVPN